MAEPTDTKSSEEPPERKSLAAAQEELVAINKVLNLQRAESYKMQEHIVMLDGEIDALKELLRKKQIENNRLVEQNHDKSKEIESLNEKVKSLRVDNGAIQIFSSQNLALLKKYEESEAALLEARTAAAHAAEDLEHYKKMFDEKSRAAAELEVSITATERGLSNKLDAEIERTGQLQEELNKYKQNLEKAEIELHFVKETTREQIQRSRATEYANIFKADAMSIGLRKAEDEKEMLSQSLNLEAFRANMLHDRLGAALETLDESQNMLLAVVEKSDDAHDTNRAQERRLRKENRALSQRLADAQEVIKIMAARCGELEQYVLERTSRDTEAFFASNELQVGGAALEGSVTDGSAGLALVGDPAEPAPAHTQDFNSVASHSLVENVTQIMNPQYQGKRCLMSKHMRCLVMLHNSISIPDNVRSPILDFSRCALTDDDMVQLVDWMRLMTLTHVTAIDFRSNDISTQGVLAFCAYVLALGGEEFKRDSPVAVLFGCNKIPLLDVGAICNFLNGAPRPEIKLVVAENDNRSIGIYGQRRTSQRVASAVFRLELQSASLDDSVPALTQTAPVLSVVSNNKAKSIGSKSKGGRPKTVGHVNAVAELRHNSASYSLKMSTSLSGESAATQIRKERSLNI